MSAGEAIVSHALHSSSVSQAGLRLPLATGSLMLPSLAFLFSPSHSPLHSVSCFHISSKPPVSKSLPQVLLGEHKLRCQRSLPASRAFPTNPSNKFQLISLTRITLHGHSEPQEKLENGSFWGALWHPQLNGDSVQMEKEDAFLMDN